jgi:hypothetical protein
VSRSSTACDSAGTEVVLQNFNSKLAMLDHAGSDNDDGDVGSASRATKTSTRKKAPAMAGTGKRGDMDDEISV